MDTKKVGFAEKIAGKFVRSKLTPVIVIVSLLLGFLSVYFTPKEEEPQISVPMIDIITPAPGLAAKEVERKVTEVVERAIWGLEGVEYLYSTSYPNSSLVTVRFKVGEPMEPSLVKVHHKLMLLRPELPNASLPQVKSYSVDDVPFLVLTFSSATKSGFELRTLAASLARKLSSTPDLSRVELLGGQKRAIRVVVDPLKMSERGVSLVAIAHSIKANDALSPSGKNWSKTAVFDVEVGGRLSSAEDVKNIAIGQFGGQIIHVKDVAKVVDGAEEITRSSILVEENKKPENAVSIVFAKRKGANVVTLSADLVARAKLFSQDLPQDVKMKIVRDYGATADEKSKELIEHLLIATLSVSILIALFMGIRAALVVAIAIPVTLALTLLIYYLLGYTLNRVTLFALVFSIGILVDDAIVVVENIERHLRLGAKNLIQATLRAVSEVGNPTILATFTVIAAILPMAFVRGLMGPYMKPIPVGASFAMIISLLVAFIVTPWAAVKLLSKSHHSENINKKKSLLDRVYSVVMSKLLGSKLIFFIFTVITAALFFGAASLVYIKTVKVKMLPFDNKQEFQVLIDYPTSTSLQDNIKYSTELAQQLAKHPEVKAVQVFAGEASPYSFSGMIKHTFLRHTDYMSDLQVVMSSKNDRTVLSHDIIHSLRPMIHNFGNEKHAVTKVLEIPPGPPVIATMVAEVYGPNQQARNDTAKAVQDVFSKEDSVVDLDTSLRLGRPRLFYPYDQSAGGMLGINASAVMQLGGLVFSETPLTSLSNVSAPEDIDVTLSVADKVRSAKEPFASLTLPSLAAGSVDVSKALSKPAQLETSGLYRKNLKPVVYVTSELSGAEEAPVYGILKIAPKIKVPLQTAEVPWNTMSPVVKWDGEWFITYEVFRDLGAAFAVVMVLIYILVLGWFRSFAVPLVIMAPIPISLIGILPGHALLGCFFTATSMIGFIAGAGIIVRNSIILVDFIEQELARGIELKDAVINAGVLRFRPMLLTAAAVIVGSSVMLSDPIFQGLAVSLIFGEIAATTLSRFTVPMLYYWFIGGRRMKMLRTELIDEGESL